MNAEVNAEERFVAIEIKLAQQEDLVETLNQLVYQQQKRIDKLDGLCAALAQHIGDHAPDGLTADNERPPHY
ncbi:MAG: SlyX protein [Janthinobacterium sp.]